MRTIVFIDGYNLYYGVVRRTPYKWLDIFKLFQERLLLPETDLLEVRYYTAPVLGSLCDDPESPQRQRQYLQALRKLYPEKVVIFEGKLVKSTPILRLAEPPPSPALPPQGVKGAGCAFCQGVKNMTTPEQQLWEALRKRQLNGYRFRRQTVLGRYMADFVCLEARLVIELDGNHHRDQQDYDHERDNWMQHNSFKYCASGITKS